jgi:hypothetical protein
MAIEFKKNKQGKYQISINGELICDKEFESYIEAYDYYKAHLQK